MTANQIYQLVNETTKEALGAQAITVKDTSSLVSLGNVVLATDTDKDAFYNKLADRIGRVYVKYRRYITDYRKGLFMQPLDFGIALQKIKTKKLSTAKSNGSWGNQINPFAKQKDTTDIESKIYSKLATWEGETKIIYDYQLKTAFTDERSMASFVNLIFNDMYNALEVELEAISALGRATAIAQCFVSSNANCKRNLLAEYRVLNPTTALTVSTCLTDVDFLKFVSREINLAMKRMQRMNATFTPAGDYDNFTSKDDLVLDVLTDASSAMVTYLQADTFHKELVSLPNYNEIDYWQGSGTSWDFDDTSSINITDENDETTEQSGIIAFIRDKEMVGVTVDRIRTKSIYNPASECNNYFPKADWGMMVDSSEQAIVFYVAE